MNARMQRTKFVSEFGPLVHKSAAIYYANLIQVENDVVVFSKTQFVEMPVTDCLLESSANLV